ncbi:hypothetical protein ES332_A07G136600v1 [Gossypium tomentosum]|uniref:Uncharacterized protein n=1 Tax=Gossypium tomentosum TaxID=34277 RepID=A0A5D2PUU5_GOSTO|nr:hypothetical protein ES332_A07G136600v1 [Gossypium tomentosum]
MPRCRYPSPGRSLCLASRGSSSVSVIPVVFMMVDAIAKAKGISINTVNFKAQIGKGNVPVMLAKPQTFMNSSGWGHCIILQDSIEASSGDFCASLIPTHRMKKFQI